MTPRRAIAIAVLVLAAALRITALCRFGLNNDEIAEVSWSRLQLRQTLAEAARDKVHPPLDYLVQHWMTSMSATECARRIPSVIAGVATVALIMFTGFRIFGWSAGVIAGLLLSFSPIHIRYSQEIRPYALGLLAVTAAISALLEYRHTQRRRWAVVWFASMIVAAYTLYFAAIVAGIASMAIIFLERKTTMREVWRRLPIIIVAAVVLYLPWVQVVIAAIRQPEFAQRDRLNTFWFSYRLQVLGTGDWRIEPISIGSAVFWLLVIAGCFVAWRASAAGRAVVIWLIGGLAAEIIVLQIHPHVSAVRHLLPAWIALFVLAGAGLSAVTRFRFGTLVAAVLCASVVAADGATLRAYYDHGRTDWRAPVKFVASRVAKNERVFASNGWAELNFGYYWREAGTPVPLERLPPNVEMTLSGPAWIVIAGCPMDAAAHENIERQELRFELPYTNHCQVWYLRSGTTIHLPHAVCMAD
ncbi:MAG: glycosyltransferase family 39 protein [Acidobacteriota bacterium]|nr:glycosyltransferase family 39 protein [Acidobacteriota bacterium]